MNRLIEKCIIKNSLNQCHDIIRSAVKSGDTVIDATAGNGNDTAFLAGLVGDEGKVYSFDIQQTAVDRTMEKLCNEKLENRVTLICDGHEHMSRHIPEHLAENIKAIMFNLGYLPSGDHHIGTKGSTTIEAIKSAMKLISVNGIITIVIYYGGDSGFEEKEQVLEFLHGINCKQFTVSRTEFINQINCPPILICIEKLRK